MKNCQGQYKKDTTGVIKRGKLCRGQYKKDTTGVIKYPMSNHLGCLIQTKSEKLWKVAYYKDTKMIKSKKTDNTMDKRNKGRIDKQPFIKHYGTQETNDRATRTTIKKPRGSAHWACIAHLTIEYYWSKFQREIIITLKNILNGGWGLSDTILKGTHPGTIYARLGPYIDASCQVWLHLAKQFQRRRLF